MQRRLEGFILHGAARILAGLAGPPTLAVSGQAPYNLFSMKSAAESVEIPIAVLQSVDTLDELEDWLTAHNPRLMRELRQARQDDLAKKFKPWQPRHVSWPTKSK